MTEAEPSNAELQTSINRLADTVERLSVAVEQQRPADNTDASKDHKGEGKKTSRVAVTGALALIGFKLGGLIGAKIGFVYNLWKEKTLFGEMSGINAQKAEGLLGRQLRHAGIGGLIGGSIGTIALGAVGWKRGDRVKDPGDLLKHPLESIGKIFGPEEKKPEVKEAETTQQDNTATPTTQWEKTITQQRQEASAAIGRA